MGGLSGGGELVLSSGSNGIKYGGGERRRRFGVGM